MKRIILVSFSRKRSSQVARTLIQVLVSMQALMIAISSSQNSLIKSFLTIMAIKRKISMSVIWTTTSSILLLFLKKMPK